jgi:serine/threonine protein kinase
MSADPTTLPRPAAELTGRRVDDTWTVGALLRTPDGTGGNFSVSYVAEDDDGCQVFVKALDFSRAFDTDDPTTLMQGMTEAYNYERDLLIRCGERNLDRVIRVLAHGTVNGTNPPVPYLVFEHADRGDIRTVLAAMEEFDLAFALRALHHTAVGLRQLHSIEVAHQDLKPSNVVVFGKQGSKLADLGRSSTRERRARHDGLVIAGDPVYSPPEQSYRYASLDWNRRRTATDLYHLGSMVMFLMTGAPMTAALMGKLAHESTSPMRGRRATRRCCRMSSLRSTKCWRMPARRFRQPSLRTWRTSYATSATLTYRSEATRLIEQAPAATTVWNGS